VSRARGSTDSDALIGLYQRSPWLGVALTIFLLSLAGMPLTGGFIGKFYIFTDTVHLKGTWLGVVLFVTSVISFYYYFGWVKKIYQRPDTAGDHQRISPGIVMNTLLAVCVAGTLVLGLVPQSLMKVLVNAHWYG
jgi:NADH-quinone oxidoreductase subunit N